jgi:hypothetical protein
LAFPFTSGLLIFNNHDDSSLLINADGFPHRSSH